MRAQEIGNIVRDLQQVATRRFTAAWERRAHFGPPAQADEIAELEGMVHGSLPHEYREFLGHARRVVTDDWSVFSPFVIARMFGSPEIPKRLVTGLPDEPKENEVFPVAGDGGGNLFLLGSRGANIGSVWFWSHETRDPNHGSASNGFHLVAASFSEFLQSILERWSKDPSGPAA